MTDYLLVHSAGQGAWTWDRVWGYLTAPSEHPPRLYVPRRAHRVYPLDLPGHGADSNGDTADVRLEECVHAIVRAVEREGLEDVVLVGHGFAAGLVLQAARQLPRPPARLVLVAGIVPNGHQSMLSALPGRVRTGFRVVAALSKVSRQELKVPPSVVRRFLCNGMEPMAVVRVLGLFGPLPTRVIEARLQLAQGPAPCPVTYVLLTRDRLLPPDAQQRMAQRIPGAEIVPMDSCHQAALCRPKELAEILLRYA